MALRIEDYALIGDCHSVALVGRDGSIDWLCLPRFDSGACFAALLGEADHGRWKIAPVGPVRGVRRRYRPGTLVLETEFETDDGRVTLVDCMPVRKREPDVARLVVGQAGQVRMRMELCIRTDYGSVVPWVRHTKYGISAVAGPETLHLHTPVETHGERFTTVSEFTVAEGDQIPFVLQWSPSYDGPPRPLEAVGAIADATAWWEAWSRQCTYQGPWREVVLRSLLTLKALTYAPTGGIVAAATTSLPEMIGGVRNWDYRACWLRDATFTLYALLINGFNQEALDWRRWLVRAVAGKPSQLNIMYGLAGERRLTEIELDWLPGYEKSAPVRVGNAAHKQFQLDVFGEVMDAMHVARRHGLDADENAWRVQRALMEHLLKAWQEPDEGIWEVRGGSRHFTHSKVMAWVAFDRAVKAVERYGAKGPVRTWREIRDKIHADICHQGFDPGKNSFVQSYGADDLDASLLMIPLVGFLPANDPRMLGTVAAIERELMDDGLVLRYRGVPEVDGLPSGEGAFLPCTFWLADNLAQQGRRDEAAEIFERLIGLCNDVGLLAEEYDPQARRMLGNFPQAFTHVGLINTAHNLAGTHHPAEERKLA
jgi:GH15 family glucan-1,4-alpha-glucosidase